MVSREASAQDDGDDGEVRGRVGLVWRFWEEIDGVPLRGGWSKRRWSCSTNLCSARLIRGDPGRSLAGDLEAFWTGQGWVDEKRWKCWQGFAD